jgi:hypothetical protein
MACLYNGSSYSDGSIVCMNGETHRCDGDVWTNLAYSCDKADGEVIIPDSRPNPPSAAKDSRPNLPTEAVPTKTARVFHLYQAGRNSSANPKIIVTKSRVSCRLGQTEGGLVKGTNFTGTGGIYNFEGDGSFEVEPGTYTLYVLGVIGGNGSIESVVSYS